MKNLQISLPFTPSNGNKKTIVKIEGSVFSNGNYSLYDRDGCFTIGEFQDAQLQRMMKTKNKKYFKATIDRQGMLKIGREIKNQHW